MLCRRRVSSASGEHGGDQTLRGTQAQRRRRRCGVPGAFAAAGDLAERLYLSAGSTCGAGSGAQAHAAGEEPHGPGPVGGEHAVARDRGRDAQLRGAAIDGAGGGGFGFNPEVERSMCANVAVIKTLNREIDKLEQRLHQCVRLRPEFRLLTSVPGIGQTLATLIMLEVGTIERFAEVGNFASYARCVDSTRMSNGKKKGQGNVKNGNAYLAWAANFAHRYCAEARRFYERKKARTNG